MKPLLRRVLVGLGILLGAYATARLPIVTVVLVLAALDAGILFYWFSVRAGRRVTAGPRAPMRALADVMRVAGVLLIVNALWVTILGVLTESGMTNEATVNWGALAATGFQVSADQPVAFGARCLAVAIAVWVVGFGLSKALGEKA